MNILIRFIESLFNLLEEILKYVFVFIENNITQLPLKNKEQ